MVQVKIYGLEENIVLKRSALSDAIHSVLTETIGTTPKKRFQRFFILEAENFIFSSDRTNNYTVIEILMFEGRSKEVKKQLIRLLYQKIEATLKKTSSLERSQFS